AARLTRHHADGAIDVAWIEVLLDQRAPAFGARPGRYFDRLQLLDHVRRDHGELGGGLEVERPRQEAGHLCPSDWLIGAESPAATTVGDPGNGDCGDVRL